MESRPQGLSGARLVGAVDFQGLSERIGISEAELFAAIFQGRSEDLNDLADHAVPHPVSDRAPPAPSSQWASLAGGFALDRRSSFHSADLDVEEADERGAPSVTVALVAAARRKVEVEGVLPELQKVCGLSVLSHVLLGLEAAGIQVAIVLLGTDGQQVREVVEEELAVHAMGVLQQRIRIEFVDFEEDWDGSTADSILGARLSMARHCGGAHFPTPFLLLPSDRIYDPASIQFLMRYSGTQGGVEQNFMVIEDATQARDACDLGLDPLLRVLTAGKPKRTGETFRIETVGRYLPVYTGVETGMLRVNGAHLFSELEKQYSATCNRLEMEGVIDSIAEKHRLYAIKSSDKRFGTYETFNSVKAYAHAQQGSVSPLFSRISRTMPRPLIVSCVPGQGLQDLKRVCVLHLQGGQGDDSSERNGKAETLLVGDEVDPIIRRLADQDDKAVFVSLRDGENALLLPARSGANLENAEEGEAYPPICDGGNQCLKAQVGLDLPSSVTNVTVTLEAPEPHVIDVLQRPPSRLGKHGELYAMIEQRVPIIGWVMIAIATIAQASAIYALRDTTATVNVQLAQIWRYLAALIVATPIFIIDVKRRGSRTRQDHSGVEQVRRHDSDAGTGPARETTPLLYEEESTLVLPRSATATPIGPMVGSLGNGVPREILGGDWNWSGEMLLAVLITVIGYWLSSLTFLWAIGTATHPELAALPSNFTPVVILVARCLRLVPGGQPSLMETLGCLVGLLGVLLCALSRGVDTGLSGLELSSADVEALCVSLFSAFMHATYAVGTKVARRKVSGPVLHICMQAGAAILAFAGLAASSDFDFSMDPIHGLFGFLYLAPTRLLSYVWMGVVVDTFGTLGFTAAMKYVGPLMVVMAGLVCGSCTVFEGVLLGAEAVPDYKYALGTSILVLGCLMVASAQNEKLTDVMKVRPVKIDCFPSEFPDGPATGRAFGSQYEEKSTNAL